MNHPSPLETVPAGDRVSCSYQPAWSEGVVLRAEPTGTLKFNFKNQSDALTWTHHANSHGQRASVKFAEVARAPF